MKNPKHGRFSGSPFIIIIGLMAIGVSLVGLITLIWVAEEIFKTEGHRVTPNSGATIDAIVTKTLFAIDQQTTIEAIVTKTMFAIMYPPPTNINPAYFETPGPPSTLPQPTEEIALLKEGEWWEYARTEYHKSGSLSNPEETLQKGIFRITLGNRIDVSGNEMFPLIVSGDIGNFMPRWMLINVGPTGNVYGAKDQSMDLYYILVRDQSKGSNGFFASFGGEALIFHTTDQIYIGHYHDYRFSNITALEVGFSDDQKNCEYFPEIGQSICTGDPDIKMNWYEYWPLDFDPVPLAMYYYSSYDSCGGGYCTSHVTEQSISLIDSGN